MSAEEDMAHATRIKRKSELMIGMSMIHGGVLVCGESESVEGVK